MALNIYENVNLSRRRDDLRRPNYEDQVEIKTKYKIENFEVIEIKLYLLKCKTFIFMFRFLIFKFRWVNTFDVILQLALEDIKEDGCLSPFTFNFNS